VKVTQMEIQHVVWWWSDVRVSRSIMGKECVEERESEVSERYREQHAACLLVRKCKGVGDLLWRARAPKRAAGGATPISREIGHMLLGSACAVPELPNRLRVLPPSG
jgi:hypothetical protein